MVPFSLLQNWAEKEAGKVVVYTTSMGIIRETYQRCLKVRQILRTHLVKFEERDIAGSREVLAEIKDRMNSKQILVPQVFVEGQHIGVSINQILNFNKNIFFLKSFKNLK